MSDEVMAAIESTIMREVGYYPSADQRAAYRAALGTAAGVCDAMADMVAQENRGRGGRGAVTKHGNELAAAMKQCGDALWALREKVTIPPAVEPVGAQGLVCSSKRRQAYTLGPDAAGGADGNATPSSASSTR